MGRKQYMYTTNTTLISEYFAGLKRAVIMWHYHKGVTGLIIDTRLKLFPNKKQIRYSADIT